VRRLIGEESHQPFTSFIKGKRNIGISESIAVGTAREYDGLDIEKASLTLKDGFLPVDSG